jgi:hypothetical protein
MSTQDKAAPTDLQLATAGCIWVRSVGTGNGPDYAGMRAALSKHKEQGGQKSSAALYAGSEEFLGLLG